MAICCLCQRVWSTKYLFVLNLVPKLCLHVHLPGEPAWERASYARRQLLSELGFAQWRTPDFWAMILMIFFTFMLRVMVHYGGQFLTLMAMKKPYSM